MIIMIDNYDSFTYNLVQYIGELGTKVQVFRNDDISLQELECLNPQGIIISPGPCTPNEAGISMNVVQQFKDKIPILGVCLGHQSIGQVFGGKVIRAKQVMHGKISKIYHNNTGVFSGLPNPFNATRYHSLVVAKEALPDCLDITAWTLTPGGEFDEIMGLKHKVFQVEGVQFHPESVLTDNGKDILQNFLMKC